MCLLTLWRRKKLIPRGSLSSEPLEFSRYLYPFQRYSKFSFFDFSNSSCLFEKILLRKLQCLTYLLCWIQIRWNFLDISYRFKDINENIFIFLTVRDHSVRLFWLKFDFYMFKMFKNGLFLWYFSSVFFPRKLRYIAVLLSWF